MVWGKNGWTYYWYDGNYKAFAVVLAGRSQDCGWKACWSGAPSWMRLEPQGGHPGPNGVAVVRSWKSTVSGTVQVDYRATKIDRGGGDGVSISIRRNEEVIVQPIYLGGTDTQVISDSVEVAVNANDSLRFFIFPNSRPEHDNTMFVVEIWLIR
jgi:hypothetical protein